MITLQRLNPENALVFRDVRLRALQDSPTAFSSTYAKEAVLPDDEWFKRSVRWSSDGYTGNLAFDGDKACGMVCCSAGSEDPARGHVISMWVDPAYRRAGVGSMLIEALKAWAAERGLRGLLLMVTDVNQSAIDFYERIGFRKTGKTGPYPNDAAITEYEMILDL
jgi:ribosomal protein S18 acetylase RimI-like enzyme